MDIFKFISPEEPTKLEQGQIINHLKSKMWIERYDQAGEFTLSANVSSGAREALPLGSLISHVDTHEVMIVENHEISEDKGKEAEITITGRGFETYLDHRIVGTNKNFPTSNGIPDTVLPANETWDQAVLLAQQHIYSVWLLDQNFALPYVTFTSDVTGTGTVEERTIPRGGLYSALLSIMKVDDLGIKVIRPGPWSTSSVNLSILIHKGVDRSKEVIFSYDTGEIESADYLWSIKKLKNAAVVSGKWVETFVDTAETNYDRRVMFVDATDIDVNVAEPGPTQQQIFVINAQMQQRGKEALAAQNRIELTKAEVSKDVVKSGYRDIFNVGDLITVNGDYSTTTKRRISEYVEIEDKNGTRAYPTLTTVEEDV